MLNGIPLETPDQVRLRKRVVWVLLAIFLIGAFVAIRCAVERQQGILAHLDSLYGAPCVMMTQGVYQCVRASCVKRNEHFVCTEHRTPVHIHTDIGE
jgi:hypothetical protein